MKTCFLIVGCFALAACGQNEAPSATDVAEAANNAAAAVAPAAFEIKETTWTFTENGKAVQESIDANGNYIANAGSEHLDHGTAVMKGNKVCFTSAMTDEGEVCWTTKPTAIGESMESVSDKGEKVTVTRVAYVPMSM